jgi:hypothetical protein
VRASGSCYIRIKCSAISFELGQPPPLPSLGKKKYSRPTNQTVADQCTGHRGHHHRLRKDERGMCSKKKRSQLSKGWASPMLSFDSELFAFFFFLFSPFLFFLFFFFLYCTQEPIRSSIDISIQSPSERFYFIFIFSWTNDTSLVTLWIFQSLQNSQRKKKGKEPVRVYEQFRYNRDVHQLITLYTVTILKLACPVLIDCRAQLFSFFFFFFFFSSAAGNFLGVRLSLVAVDLVLVTE